MPPKVIVAPFVPVVELLFRFNNLPSIQVEHSSKFKQVLQGD